MESFKYEGFEKIHSLIPDAIVDLKYFGKDNFMKEPLYDQNYDILRKSTLIKLKNAGDILRKQGYRLVIWDAFRPLKIQRILWEKIKDPKFVANPQKGSIHNRGCAVDLWIADKEGNLLDMPSYFDDFSETASAATERLEGKKKEYLLAVQQAMLESEFEILMEEWWHFVDSQWENFEII